MQGREEKIRLPHACRLYPFQACKNICVDNKIEYQGNVYGQVITSRIALRFSIESSSPPRMRKRRGSSHGSTSVWCTRGLSAGGDEEDGTTKISTISQKAIKAPTKKNDPDLGEKRNVRNGARNHSNQRVPKLRAQENNDNRSTAGCYFLMQIILCTF
jgi:hypothetical protein